LEKVTYDLSIKQKQKGSEMADKGKRDKGKREEQKKGKLTPKEKRRLKKQK